MVSINPSDPDYRNATGTAASVPARDLPLESEPAEAPGMYRPVWPLSGVPWGGIIAGSIATISTMALSSALAAACDVPAYRGGPYGVGAGFWVCITAIIAFFVGGAIAGMVPPRERMGGAVRGFVTWALTIVLTLLLSMSVFGFIHGATNVTGVPGAASVTGNGSITGPAWGTFIAMALGLIFAIAGGVYGALAARGTRAATTRP